MSITGIDAVTFGVRSLAKAKRFMADWGLQQVRAGNFGADYVSVDGGEVKIRSHDRAAIIDAEPGEYAAFHCPRYPVRGRLFYTYFFRTRGASRWALIRLSRHSSNHT